MQECCRLRTMYFWRYMWTEVIVKSSVRNNDESSLFFLTMNWELIIKKFFAWHAEWNFHCDLGHKVVCTLWTERSKTTRQHFLSRWCRRQTKLNSFLYFENVCYSTETNCIVLATSLSSGRSRGSRSGGPPYQTCMTLVWDWFSHINGIIYITF